MVRDVKFSRQDVEVVKEEPIYSGFFRLVNVRLRHRLFRGGWSREFSRELFAKAEAASAVVYDPVLDLIGLVDQFRVGTLDSPYGPWTLESVAGMVEEGESPANMMLRELQEEAGLQAKDLLPITGFYPTPGSCNEYTHLFCAICDLSGAGGLFGVDGENEDILFTAYPADDVFNAMLQSRMNNAATLIGLQWLQLNRPRLRAQWQSWS
ncbi:NUDIX domain-containing protein [Saccharophagus sp. K07]|jgi:ADP-ribose pyrophosphatase|uniref:NUDIX domain-containing protein n=1 Tax=Saccharophagus sp. K07 TaxID=2283636 RepID=UPI001652B2BB|nr:NUDIX domain-containing protein [Saccharophagus sp. K07]MBC6906427.1 NUDIX domain-containing protein [Saccharophagus sp. K07]